jgi:hypothetical protein
MREQVVFWVAALAAGGIFATPDFGAKHYADIRENFAKKTEAIEASRKDDVAKVLERQLKEATQREVKARVSGNASAKADSSQLVKMLTDALESLKKDGAFTFPDKIRPANERFTSLCLQALKNANNAASDARSILLLNSRDELRKLLEAEGIKPTADLLDTYWNSLLEAAPAVAGTGAEGISATPAAKSADDGGEATVYAVSRAGKDWRYIARIDITTPGMEMFEIPLFPIEQGKTAVRGTGMAGSKWLAFLSAPRSAMEPKGSPAFRLKRIEGKGNIDVMTWPSASNGWVFELRVRPVSGTSGNACLIEMGD